MLSKYLLIFCGILFLCLAFIGYVIPPIPATPFLIIAAICFSKSSPRLYNWILARKHVGVLVQAYVEHRVIPLKLKLICSAAVMFFGISLIVFVCILWWVQLLIGVVCFLSVIVIFIHPSKPKCLLQQKSTE